MDTQVISLYKREDVADEDAVTQAAVDNRDFFHAQEDSQENLDALGEFFKLLTDTTRLKILYALSSGELCVFDISVAVGASVPTVSHHLGCLKRGKLVRGRRMGRVIYYSLDDEHVTTILGYARMHLFCEVSK